MAFVHIYLSIYLSIYVCMYVCIHLSLSLFIYKNPHIGHIPDIRSSRWQPLRWRPKLCESAGLGGAGESWSREFSFWLMISLGTIPYGLMVITIMDIFWGGKLTWIFSTEFRQSLSHSAESFTAIQRFLEHLRALKTDAVQILASTNVETSLAWDMTDSECAGWLAAYDGDDLKEFES